MKKNKIMTHCIRVNLGERSYPILVGGRILKEIGRLCVQSRLSRHAIVVAQKEVAHLHGRVLERSLSQKKFKVSWFLTPSFRDSEKIKSEAVYRKLLRFILQEDRKGSKPFLIALGGGSIGDLTGFTASVYKRGIPYIQVPTTLLAQVDSAIGGKTAIDLPAGKNLIGSFYQPCLVLSDVDLLKTLPRRRRIDGLAEVVKYGVISDRSLFDQLERRSLGLVDQDPRKLLEIIRRCCQIKVSLVETDEQDSKGLRAILNFGHTFAHAFETARGYSSLLSHGEAVSIGMVCAAELSERMGLLKDRTTTQRIEGLLDTLGLPVCLPKQPLSPILKAMNYDKKFSAGKNRFILLERLGKTVVREDISMKWVTQVIQNRMNNSRRSYNGDI